MRDLIREPAELLELTGLPAADVNIAGSAAIRFPLRVPPDFVQRIEKNNPADPLLRQVLPLAEEDETVPGYSGDPVGELEKHRYPGLIQKYHGRVLLITTAVCAIHCRYCFRRDYPYSDNHAGRNDWTEALQMIGRDTEIHEVILSGGDPLSLADDKLELLVRKLEGIPHLKWLRVHSRIPVVLPERITPRLVQILGQNRFRQTLVIHCNHPNEINADVSRRLKLLQNAGITLLNQSVLLRGVNDDALVLAELSERLYGNHVLPYYIHMLDPVGGAAHFDVDLSRARQIMHELRSRLPGYLVPRLVREEAGQAYKTLIT